VQKGERGLSHVKSRRPRKVQRVTKARQTPLTKRERTRAKDASADNIAFLAARSIFEHGIRPTHWNKEALDANKAQIIRDVTNALKRAANEINRG
jgi:hypothetical protein